MYSDYYAWSVNLSINPRDWVWMRVWKGDVYYDWSIRKPFRIERVDTRERLKTEMEAAGFEVVVIGEENG